MIGSVYYSPPLDEGSLMIALLQMRKLRFSIGNWPKGHVAKADILAWSGGLCREEGRKPPREGQGQQQVGCDLGTAQQPCLGR